MPSYICKYCGNEVFYGKVQSMMVAMQIHKKSCVKAQEAKAKAKQRISVKVRDKNKFDVEK